ncbi:MAG: SpoIIE family protein phosphatase, partial [Blastocatellia bacterium]|nr:SpoIIE family protein phosphatase [Blastocatellia bacterium]
QAPRTVYLDKPKQTVGRSSRADVNITDSFASRIHAVLELRVDGVWLTDLGSQNGTYLNENRVVGEISLRPGDCIRIGETELLYRLENQETNESLSAQSGRTSVVFYNDTTSSSNPEATIALEPGSRMSRVLVPYKQATQSLSDKELQKQVANDFIRHAQKRDLLPLVSKVGLMLSDWSLDKLLENILDTVFENIPAERGFLLLTDEKNELVCKVARYRVPPTAGTTPEVSISRHISDMVMHQKSVLTSDALRDDRFAGAQSIVLSGMRSCMAVPLALHEQVLGMIYVDNPYETRFNEDDLLVMTTIASVAAIKVEHAKFLQAHIERQRIEQELEVAASIQKRILPQDPPVIEGLEIVGVNIPCHTVGGDYYDFVITGQDTIGFVIADVSGKGIPAALLVSTLQATFRATIEHEELENAIRRINKVICRSTTSYSYITFFYGLLDRNSRCFTSINAGHNAPILIRKNGRIERLQKGGFCLGMFERAEYELEQTYLAEGDILCLYTDGVTEATNINEEEFGEDRLIKIIKENQNLELNEISKRLYREIENFVGEAPQHDDLTYVMLRFTTESDGETIIFDIPDDE